MKRNFLGLALLAWLAGCSPKKDFTPEERQAYEASLNAWHTRRLETVKAPDGWLNLVGLYWLEPGPNTFGSNEKNNIVFPKGKIAEHAGYFIVQDNQVILRVNTNVPISVHGKPIATEQVVFHPDSSAIIAESGSLRWNIIRRDTKLAIRLRDLDSEATKSFADIERYPVDPAFRVAATFEKADSSRTIDITNIVGQTTAQPSPGTLVFDLLGKKHRLDVLEGNKEEFFVIFADVTSGNETYGGGRFVYVKKPVADEAMYIDFNKAYNPPCVFTPYATCPLPPRQNVLAVEVKAGEKNYSAGGQSGNATVSVH
ncbi:MAG TPA: DUF1684 domain-containing protein [Chryseolinea sp.]